MTQVKNRRQRNSHFTFKRFHIDQTDCAMKVSSDACLLGAFVPLGEARYILDIGTGTGLLALMVAQRAAPGVHIDAVEISPAAAAKAYENVAASPFADAVHVHQGPIQQHEPSHGQRYELILANPPFYQNSLRGHEAARNLAWHAGPDGLDFTGLIDAVVRLMVDTGLFWVLLPMAQHAEFTQLAAGRGLHERERLSICHKPGDAVNRVISAFSRCSGPLLSRIFMRCDQDGCPSSEARTLFADYMLHY